jgi:hypothetical protein
MSKNKLLVLLVLIPLGCRTSMGTRRDASPGTEAGTAPPIPDALVTSDTARGDVSAPDAAPAVGVPKAFRIENRSDRTIYLQTDLPVDCQMAEAAGWRKCTYFQSCSLLCSQVINKQCCVECEQNLELYAIPAGQIRSIPWDGRIFTKQSDPCSQCQCDQPLLVEGGSFVAMARIYIAYQCMPSGCQTSSDDIIRMATPVGPSSSYKVPFSIPFAAHEVVIDVTELPDAGADAGAPETRARREFPDSAIDTPADSSPADTARDRGSEVAPASLAEVAGRTFGLSANDALPDAGLYGRSCATSNPGANYAVTFSSDGAKVTIRRTDPIQEVVLTGTLQTGSSSNLAYNIDNAFAGGSLQIRREGGDLIGELAIYGSGAPVIWCIQSPMRPLS